MIRTGKSTGICESCGTEAALPWTEDDQYAELYNRANTSRMKGNYERAYSAYEHLTAQNPEDAEAHWGLMLCRYGIEYVKDGRTGEYFPTIRRIQYRPVTEDVDYQAALKYSDGSTAKWYQREGEKLSAIWEKYIQIINKEPPCDVFICFKEKEDASGSRTKDSEIGQDIYDALTANGLNVFFSRISLEEKVGEEYEPYIFAALHTAKVMLLIGTKKEYLESRWVRNEWSRYLLMMREDSSKHIIPVYAGIRPEDFPREIPVFQGADIGQAGAIQDLTANVLKFVGSAKTPVWQEQEEIEDIRERQIRFAKLQEKIGASLSDYLERQLRFKEPLIHSKYRELCLACASGVKQIDHVLWPTAGMVVSFLIVILILSASLAGDEEFLEKLMPLFCVWPVCVELVRRGIKNQTAGAVKILGFASLYFFAYMVAGATLSEILKDSWTAASILFLISGLLTVVLNASWLLRLMHWREKQKYLKDREKYYQEYVYNIEQGILQKLRREYKSLGMENWAEEGSLRNWDGKTADTDR